MAAFRIAVLGGDGIGPEVIEQAVRVVDRAVAKHDRAELHWTRLPWSSAYYKQHGRILPADGWDTLQKHDAIFFGAIGSPDVPDTVTVHDLLLPMRRRFDQYVNLRPAYLFEGVPGPLRDKAPGSIDMLVYRENTEGEYAPVGGRLYQGMPAEVAINTAVFTRRGCERIMRAAFEAARRRPRKKVTSVTKSNALAYGMVLWDEAFKAVAKDYPDVSAGSLLVDAAAMDFVRKPESFDVVVASNLFGDILTDLSAAVTGSIGLAASANINPERAHPSMFEPVHGSAPDIAGKGIANPLAAVLSAGLMLDHLGLAASASAVRGAVAAVLKAAKALPADLGGKATTAEVAEAVLAAVDKAVSKPYDATTKDLLEMAPADWLAFLGHPAPGQVRLIDTDLSTVTTQADKVLLVEEDPPWLLHLEFQSSRDETLLRRLLRYNVLLAERHRLPVSSAAILLRSDANGPELTGLYRDRHRLDGREHRFPYRVVRLWRLSAEEVLAGGVGTLPLAPLARVRRSDLPGVLYRMRERITAEAPIEKRKMIWTATYVLMGLRYPEALAEQLLQGVLGMEESVTYQAIIRKGEARGEIRGIRHMLLRTGRNMFGPPDAATLAAIEAIEDRAQLEELHDRMFAVDSWHDLLAPSGLTEPISECGGGARGGSSAEVWGLSGMSNHVGGYMLNDILKLCHERGVFSALGEQASDDLIRTILKIAARYDCNRGEILEELSALLGLCMVCLQRRPIYKQDQCRECWAETSKCARRKGPRPRPWPNISTKPT